MDVIYFLSIFAAGMLAGRLIFPSKAQAPAAKPDVTLRDYTVVYFDAESDRTKAVTVPAVADIKLKGDGGKLVQFTDADNRTLLVINFNCLVMFNSVGAVV